jgi:hypothetical protein
MRQKFNSFIASSAVKPQFNEKEVFNAYESLQRKCNKRLKASKISINQRFLLMLRFGKNKLERIKEMKESLQKLIEN